MLVKVSYAELVGMLRAAAVQIRENQELLSKLDSVGGDGDHGTTMVRAVTCLERAIETSAPAELPLLLHEVGWAILGVDGGATGPLLGTFFLGMSESVAGKDALDARALSEAFEAGLNAVRARTKAQVGDKTLMDALVPAVERMRTAVDADQGLIEALRAAAEGAEEGAESTRALQARFGRAKNIREKSVGTRDPGATSVSLLFKGFLKGVETNA